MKIENITPSTTQPSFPRFHSSPLAGVAVHGHEQCSICKSNIFECCVGGACDSLIDFGDTGHENR